MRPSPLLPAVLAATLTVVLALPVLAAPAGGTAASGEPPSARAIVGSHSMCGGTPLQVTDNARFTTGFETDPAWPFTLDAGLWVGAMVDRGNGPEASVSTGLFGLEFFSPENPPPALRADARPTAADLRVGGIQAVMRDTYTPDWLPDHRPLGLEVVQESHPMQMRGDVTWIDVKYTVTNISHELDGRDGEGWDLENVYLGILADPDVGFDPNNAPWEDDLGGFEAGPQGSSASTIALGAARGDLAYVIDHPGTQGDDTDVQVGIVLRTAPAHRFAIWPGGLQDPSSDAERYARMRGNSDEEPTIDPPATTPADQRVLLAVGPLARLAPGESTGFGISLVCGDLVVLTEASGERPRTVRAPDLVVPRGAPGVRLSDDRDAEVWSVAGRRLATVGAGQRWDLRAGGVPVASGVYFYRPVDGSAPAARIVILR